MKKYKIILELLLAVVLMIAGYYIYKIAMNMRHDMPIITGQVSDNDLSHIKNGLSSSSIENINTSGLDTVATFTESLSTLETEITYPKERSDILERLMTDYDKWKSEIKDQIEATSTYNGAKLEYKVYYKGQANNTSQLIEDNNIKSYTFDSYTYTGGAHGSTGMYAFNFDKNNKKIDDIYDLYLIVKNQNDKNLDTNNKNLNASATSKLKTKDDIYKKIYDTIKVDLGPQLKEKYGTEKVDIKWFDEGIAYSATSTDNYNIWWVDGDSLVIYVSQYQIAPYVYGDFETRVPLSGLME